MPYRLGPTLITASEIQARIQELATAISRDYAGRELLLICVLKGAAVFWADLCRGLRIPCQSDFVAMESYGKATSPLAEPRFTKAADVALADRDILIVEDIVDTGHTLSYLLEMLAARHPASLKTCALVTKPSRREREVPIEYVGFEIPDEWVVGYGLDYKDHYRTLPYIGVIQPDE